MNNDDFLRLKTLFDGLADLSEAQRLARLAREDIDESMRRQLRALLDADGMLDGTTARRAVASAFATDTAWIGRRVGAYVLERELGRGGMGSVFLGHRADGSVEHKVAVKLIRPEQLDDHTLARFRLERQVLALLKHPNIATLLDLGELDDGTPYVVIEYIEGRPIVEYAKQIDLHQRLRLFVEICDAVAYAHRNMVVHRDLKSSNVLVTPQGQSKLLDFGIAKPLLHRFGTQEILETGAAQRFFSPYNAAPEQLRGDPITVGCDVYGLGVLLYELLARAAPFDFVGKTADEIQRLILETEPPLPSARAESTDAAVARSLRGDLDAIVLRALRKASSDRYATVEQFAEDVRNYLEDRPVVARRGRVGYRTRKFVSRHRIALGAVALLVLIISGAAAALWTQALEVVRQRDRAVHATNFLIETFRAADPEKTLGEKLTAKEILDQAARSLTADTSITPELRAELLGRIAEVKLHLNAPKDALSLVAQALQELNHETRADKQTRAWLLELEARGAMRDGRYDLAKAALAEAGALDPNIEIRGALEIDTIEFLYQQGATTELQPHFDRVLNELAPKLLNDVPLRWALLTKVAGTELVVVGAEPAIKLLLDLLHEPDGASETAPHVLKAKFMLVAIYNLSHRTKEAESLLDSLRQPTERLYGADSIAFATWANEMANVLQKNEEYAKALELYSVALALDTKWMGPVSASVANTRFNIAGAAEGAEHWEEAEKNYRDSIELAAKVFPDTNENIEMFRTAYALFLNKRHRFADAGTVFKIVIERAIRDPAFVDDDVYKAALLGRTLADYAAAATPGNRIEFERTSTLPEDASSDLKQIAAEQRAVAKSLGLSVAP